MAYTVKTRVGGVVTLGLHLVKDGVGIVDQAPTVELRRLSDNTYFNWAALVAPFWVASGGTREGALPATLYLPGLYSRAWDQSVYDDQERDYLVIYRNTGIYAVQEIEIQSFTFEWADDCELVRKLLANKTLLRKFTDAHYQQFSYDDDGSVLKTDDITIVGADEKREPV